MPKAQETVLEIDLSALEHNFKYLSQKAGKGVKRMAIIKGNAYGSEVVAVAQKLEELEVEYLAVAFPSEGIFLREAGLKLPILVFQPQPMHFKSLIDHCLEPSLFNEKYFREFIKTAEANGQKDYPVHLKFNTGLNRLGFSEKDTPMVQELLASSGSVKAASVFSHLAASANWREREFSLEQIYSFKRIAMQLLKAIDYEPLFHMCNTSGIINYPEATFDMVRMGIGLYGYGNDDEVNKDLRPMATLKTIVAQINELEEGETLGYGRSFKAERPTKTATLPVGYGDGISRKYGNKKAGVYINGRYAPIIGNVCMDMIMVDITDVPCTEGDEVIVFGGPQPGNVFAEAGDTISYELLTSISPRVKRILV